MIDRLREMTERYALLAGPLLLLIALSWARPGSRWEPGPASYMFWLCSALLGVLTVAKIVELVRGRDERGA